MKKKKNILTTIILVLILVFGLSLLLYPTISDQWNKRRSSQAIAVYEQAHRKMQYIAEFEHVFALFLLVERVAVVEHAAKQLVRDDVGLLHLGEDDGARGGK